MVITSAASSSIFPPGIFAIAGVPPVDLLISTPSTSASSADIVDISALGQLLSATSIFESGILQTTATTPNGFATLATATQLFVDAFNNFLQSGSNNLLNPPGLSIGNLFAQALASRTISNGTSVIASLSSVGINFVPPLLPNGTAQLTIDFQSLQSAFNTDAAATASLLAQAIQSIGQLAVEVSNTAVQLENLTQIGSSLTLAVTAGELTNATSITTASLIAPPTTPQTTAELLPATGTPVTTAQTVTELLAAAALSITPPPLTATTTQATTVLPATALLPTAELPVTTVSAATQPATELPTTTTPATAVTPSATITTPVTAALPTVTEALPATGQTTAAVPLATQTATELPTTATPQIVTPVATTTTTTALPAATTQIPAAVLPTTVTVIPAATEVPTTITPATTPAVSAPPTTPLTTLPTTPNVTPNTLINRVADASDPTIAAAIMAYHLVDGILDTGARHYTRPPAAFIGRDEVQHVSPIHRTRLDLHA